MEDQYITTVLWRHKLLVACCVAAAVAAAVAATLLVDKTYEARATLQAGALANRSGGVSPEANQALARSYAEVLTSGSFLERIRPSLDTKLSVRELQDRLSAEAIPDTAVVRVKARAGSVEAARDLAAAVTANFIATLRIDATERARRQQAQLDALVDDLTRRIERPAPEVPPSTIAQLRASRQALLEQGAGLVADGVAEAGSARRVGPPSASADPVSPRPRLNIVAGIVLGLLLGAALAWWRERRAPALRSAEHAASLTDVPVLATIPLRRRAAAGDPVLGEAYDILHANFTFQARDHGPRVVTVIGENARVGKTSTVEGLALAAVRSGRSVALVDADLRMGELSARLGYGDSYGLRDIVGGGRSLDEVLVDPAPGLVLVPAHVPTPDPPSLLHSARTRDVIRKLRERFDLVLIDSPPIGQLADGLILASLSDAVLMVARSGVTSRPSLVSGVAKVRQTRTPIIGLVVFTALDLDASYYPAIVGTQPRAEDALLSR